MLEDVFDEDILAGVTWQVLTLIDIDSEEDLFTKKLVWPELM